MKKILFSALLFLGVLSFTGCYESASAANSVTKTTKTMKCGAGTSCSAKKGIKCGAGKCGEGKKAMKCGDGKCGDAMQKPTMKCGAGKCGSAK